jgi:hypothetical protein
MIEPGRTTTFWVIATFSLAMLPQLLRMPLPVAALTLAPLLWRIAAEARGWQRLPALQRHALTGLALVVLFVAYGDLSGRRSAVSLLTLMLALKLIEGYRIPTPGWSWPSACSCAPLSSCSARASRCRCTAAPRSSSRWWP